MQVAKQYKWLIVLATLLWSGFNIHAQSDFLLHGFRSVPQNSYTNPAFAPDSGIVFGFPLLSSVSNSTYSSAFTFNDLFSSESGNDSLYLNLAPVIGEGVAAQSVRQALDNDLLYFGISIKKGFLSFGIRHRYLAQAYFTDDLLKLLWYGSPASINNTLDLSQTQVNSTHFVSYFAAWAFPLGDRVKLGARLSLNRGMSAVYTEHNDSKLWTEETAENVYSVYAKTDFLVHTSGLTSEVEGEGINPFQYYYNYRNLGASIDVGADIKVSQRFNVNLSATDLGFIGWKTNLQSYTNLYDTIQFDGLDIENGGDGIFGDYADTLEQMLKVDKYQSQFKTWMPARVMAGAEYYSLNRTHRISVLFAGRFFRDHFEPAFSVGYDQSVSKIFAFKLSYTYLQYAPLNIGAGVVFNFGPLQLYFLTDNVLSVYNYKSQHYINFRFGINLMYGEN